MWGKAKVVETQIQCSLTKPLTVFIEPMPRQKIQILMAEYTHQEWLAYLRGRISDKANIFVEDIEVPPHASANGASAEAEPFHIPKDCVGIIHSHHGMGAFHSGTDQTYVDRNFPISITVARSNNDLVFDAVSYQVTPCSKGTFLKCLVKYVQPPILFNKEEFLKEAKRHINGHKEKSVSVYIGEHYTPVRYRLKDTPDEPHITDGSGRVIPPEEYKKLMNSIFKE